jgi:acyl-CoA thioesterase-1
MVDNLESGKGPSGPDAGEMNGAGDRHPGRFRGAPRHGIRRVRAAINGNRVAVTIVLIFGTVAWISSASAPRTIVAFGDSYFSGYGLDPTDSFPVRFERALRDHGRNVRVLNEGVPGETLADGLARLDQTLATKPALIILELGANDAEQRMDPAIIRANLDRMLARIRAAHVRVLLCGVLAPTEYGEAYQGSVDPIYPSLAAKHRVPFYPFILDGVSSDSDLIQDDGEHPNERGVEVMVQRMLPVVEKIVR